jgi:hypothetical protein
VHFLKHKLAVVCSKGFEIMDLTECVARSGCGLALTVLQPQRRIDPHLRLRQSARPPCSGRIAETV